MPIAERIPDQFRYEMRHTKIAKALITGKLPQKDHAKASYTYKNSQLRFRTRSMMHFDRYDLHIDGISHAKPNVNYTKEIDARRTAPYLIGLEIEIEARTFARSDDQDDDGTPFEATLNNERLFRLANALNTHLPESTYVCTDGSLREGCEIVTAPRTLQEVKQSFHNYYRFLRKLRKAGYQSHDSGRCGLHMHISKQAMSNEKWNSLSRILARHQAFFKLLSRRDGNFQYCSFTGHNGRYMALNKQNSTTNEFRFFRGTLKPESFLASLEIMLSLVEHWRVNEKPTFAKWKTELKKWKYGYTYALPHFPTVQEVRRISDEEKEEKRIARQAKRERKLRWIQSEIDTIKYRTTDYLGTLGSHSAKIGDRIVGINLPLIVTGYTKPIRDYVAKNPQHITLACTTSYAETMSAKHKVIASSRSSWGRTSRYAHISSYDY